MEIPTGHTANASAWAGRLAQLKRPPHKLHGTIDAVAHPSVHIFSLAQSLRPYDGPGVDLVWNRNEYQGYLLGQIRPDPRNNNLGTFMYQLFKTFWEPETSGALRACPDVYKDTYSIC